MISLGVIAEAQTQYFPPSTSTDAGAKRADNFIREWYSQQLTGLKEPSLLERSKDKAVREYRFLWLRTFHHPIAITVEFGSDGSANLRVKEADGAGDYRPGRVIRDLTRPLMTQEASEFSTKLQRAEPWKKTELGDTGVGTDGAQWIFERAEQEHYSVADYWSPEKGPIHDLGLLFIHLAKLKIPKNEIY